VSLDAACGRIRIVDWRGRRYVCRPPTVATLRVASRLFSGEIASFAHAVKERPDLMDPATYHDTLGKLLGVGCGAASGELLETCVRRSGGGPGDVAADVADDLTLSYELIVAVVSLCDVHRCFKAAGWDRIGATPVEVLQADVDPDEVNTSERDKEIAIVKLATEHGCSPMEVMAWPFEVFLMVTHAARFIHGGVSDTEREFLEAAHKPFPPGALEHIGYVYEKN
jgi:hypothetical protein